MGEGISTAGSKEVNADRGPAASRTPRRAPKRLVPNVNTTASPSTTGKSLVKKTVSGGARRAQTPVPAKRSLSRVAEEKTRSMSERKRPPTPKRKSADPRKEPKLSEKEKSSPSDKIEKVRKGRADSGKTEAEADIATAKPQLKSADRSSRKKRLSVARKGDPSEAYSVKKNGPTSTIRKKRTPSKRGCASGCCGGGNVEIIVRESPETVSRKKAKKISNESEDDQDDTSSFASVLGSPDIVFNRKMTKSKLRLLQSSPIRRRISSNDFEVAATEVAASKGKVSGKRGKSTSKGVLKDAKESALDAMFESDGGASDTSDDDDREGKSNKKKQKDLEVVKSKEARTIKWKARKMRMEGVLPTSEPLSSSTGVLYLGHIPHGFYEKEMRGYFSQFGEVLRVRLSRSKKTARSRGYAFLEFADKDVAEIAAEAMDGYLMHGQALVAKFIPSEKVHPDSFKGANRTFRSIPRAAIERRGIIARAKDPMKLAKRSRHIQKNAKGKRKALKKMGIEYEFPEIQGSS